MEDRSCGARAPDNNDDRKNRHHEDLHTPRPQRCRAAKRPPPASSLCPSPGAAIPLSLPRWTFLMAEKSRAGKCCIYLSAPIFLPSALRPRHGLRLFRRSSRRRIQRLIALTLRTRDHVPPFQPLPRACSDQSYPCSLISHLWVFRIRI